MRETSPMGMNKTGMQMSPIDSSTMQSPPSSAVPGTPGDLSAFADMRSLYASESDSVGSVPVPGTMTGMVSTGMSMLTGNDPKVLIDKLGERLAFERGGTRLYDALIAKCESMQDGYTGIAIDDLRKIRNDEARHFSIVVDAIESLGGDPTAQTPSADLVGVEAMGLIQTVTDPRTTVAQSLHAILAAELIDNSGWEILIALAESQNQNAMLSEFSIALDEERGHLRQVQAWYQEAILGTTLSSGTAGMTTHH
jgi:bacterioferritin (cytochrome b1)